MSEQNINTKDFIIGALVGGMVGAALALAFAPKSGKELRRDINYGAHQAKEVAVNWKQTAQEKGTEWKDIALVKGTEFKQKAVESTSEIAKNVAQKTQDITQTVQAKFTKNDSDHVENADQEQVDVTEQTEDSKQTNVES